MINKLVSVDNVLVNLLDSLGLDHNKYKPMFVNWAMQAEKQIGSYYQYKRKICVLDINNCIAELPCDAKIFELALLGDYGCDCGNLFNKVSLANLPAATSVDSTFLIIDIPSDTNSCYYVNYVIQDNNLIIDRNYDGQKITIQYLGVVLDENEIPKVMENHLLAIEEYCMYKFRRRHPRTGIEVGLYRDHKREWEQLAACARGDDAELNDSERRQISDMINNPLSGRNIPQSNYQWQNI